MRLTDEQLAIEQRMLNGFGHGTLSALQQSALIQELRELRKDKRRLTAALLDCLDAMALRQESNQEAYDAATINASAAMNAEGA